MRDIIDGFLRFQRDAYPARSQLFKSWPPGKPQGTVHRLLGQSGGPRTADPARARRTRVIRNASNIVPGYGPQPGGSAPRWNTRWRCSGSATSWSAATPDCGAMGAIASCACLDQLPAVAGWLHHAEAARAMNSAHEHASEAARLDARAAQRDRPTGQPAHPPASPGAPWSRVG